MFNIGLNCVFILFVILLIYICLNMIFLAILMSTLYLSIFCLALPRMFSLKNRNDDDEDDQFTVNSQSTELPPKCQLTFTDWLNCLHIASQLN